MPYPDSLERLRNIMDELREKCPWDRKQTLQTLRPQTLEEIYELADAITEESWDSLKEELGDVLLHIVFYARIAGEQEQFKLEDVIEGVCNKLVLRHPHIYGHVIAENEEQVKKNWQQLKLKEGKKSVLSGVPQALPALIKALRLQEKTRQVGFEWDHPAQVWDKVQEELGELQQAVAAGANENIEQEFGDVLFALINYARFLKIDPENALERTNKKFMRRFRYIEEMAEREGKQLSEMDLQEMDALWNQAKKTE